LKGLLANHNIVGVAIRYVGCMWFVVALFGSALRFLLLLGPLLLILRGCGI